MEKMEIKLKKCCLSCEHFYLGSAKLGIMGCGPYGPREIACMYMPVCAKYQADLDTLTRESTGEVASKPIAVQGIRAAVLFLEDGRVLYVGPALEGGGLR